MSDLTNLQLNRYLYKDNSTLDPSKINSSIFSNIGGIQGQSNTDQSPSAPQIPANNVAPGTVIVSCLLQSTSSKNRVEMNPNDDAFYAYNDGDRVVIINSQGIDARNIYVDYITVRKAIDANLIQVLNLDVDGIFQYRGIPQPQIGHGHIEYDGNPVFLPTGWTVTYNGPGDYTVVHNLNSGEYSVCITVISGDFICSSPIWNLNDFQVKTVDLLGNPTDCSFYFQLMNNQ